jgi:hypothetical protein
MDQVVLAGIFCYVLVVGSLRMKGRGDVLPVTT